MMNFERIMKKTVKRGLKTRRTTTTHRDASTQSERLIKQTLTTVTKIWLSHSISLVYILSDDHTPSILQSSPKGELAPHTRVVRRWRLQWPVICCFFASLCESADFLSKIKNRFPPLTALPRPNLF